MLNDLDAFYWQQGRYGEAEPLFLPVLRIREQQLGPHHLSIAEKFYNLAAFYTDQGRYEMSEQLLQRTLCIRST